MRFDNDFNSKFSRESHKSKPLKKRVSKLNSIARNSDKLIYIYENAPKRKTDYFNLIYKE